MLMKRHNAMGKLFVVLAAAALMLVAGAACATIYRWTGPGGSLHFGQTPPRGAHAHPFDPNAPPPPGNDKAEKRLQAYVKGAEQQAQQSHRQAQARQRQQARALARQHDCELARRQRRQLEQGNPHHFIYKNAQGQEKRLTYAERQRGLKALDARIRQYCGPQRSQKP